MTPSPLALVSADSDSSRPRDPRSHDPHCLGVLGQGTRQWTVTELCKTQALTRRCDRLSIMIFHMPMDWLCSNQASESRPSQAVPRPGGASLAAAAAAPGPAAARRITSVKVQSNRRRYRDSRPWLAARGGPGLMRD